MTLSTGSRVERTGVESLTPSYTGYLTSSLSLTFSDDRYLCVATGCRPCRLDDLSFYIPDHLGPEKDRFIKEFQKYLAIQEQASGWW